MSFSYRIPPTIGFYAKYYIIVALLDAELLWLAISIVLMSAVSAFFYLRVVAVMYFQEGKESTLTFSTPMLNTGIVIMVIGVFAMGLRIYGTDPQWTYLLIGVLIIAAVAIDQWIRKVAG